MSLPLVPPDRRAPARGSFYVRQGGTGSGTDVTASRPRGEPPARSPAPGASSAAGRAGRRRPTGRARQPDSRRRGYRQLNRWADSRKTRRAASRSKGLSRSVSEFHSLRGAAKKSPP